MGRKVEYIPGDPPRIRFWFDYTRRWYDGILDWILR